MKLASLLLLILSALPLYAGRTFNGSTDKITANGIGSALDISGGNLTVSFWWYPTSVNSGTQAAVAHFSNGVGGSQFWVGLGVPSGIAAANQLGYGVGCCGAVTGESYANCASASTANKWYQVVLWSINGTSTGLLVNGGTFCNISTGWDGATISPGQHNFTIGNQTPGTSYPATGIIAEIAVWNTTLTLGQMKALASVCPVGGAARRMGFPQPAGYFPLWGVASPEPDLSGNVLNGTLTGTSPAIHAPCTP
jgi:hypothetical protein